MKIGKVNIEKGSLTLFLAVMAAAMLSAVISGSLFSADSVTAVAVAPITGGMLTMLAFEKLAAVIGMRFSASLSPAILGLLAAMWLAAAVY